MAATGSPETVQSGAHEDEHDVIVVGSGIAGLVAAALLAKAGMKVVVVEQADGPGGYAHSFRRGPYTFDPAIHVTLQGRDGLLPDVLYRHLGIRDRIDLVRLKEPYDVVFPGTTIRVPYTFEEFAAAHAEHPEEEPFFADLLRLCMWGTVPTAVDPSLAPPGEHIVILTSLASYDIGRPWKDEKDRFEQQMLDDRMTPIEGLYLAGHWTQPGAGSLRVLVSGVHAAMVVLTEAGVALPDLRSVDQLAPL